MRTGLVSGAIALTVAACAYRQDKAGTLPARSQQGAVPSFVEIKEKVMGPAQCLRCHQECENYADVYGERDLIRQKVFVDHTMPKGGTLTPEQADLFLRWLDAGAPEQGSAPVTEPQPVASPTGQPGHGQDPTWANVQNHFFQPYCFKCHSGDSPEADLDLSDLAQVRKAASSILRHVFVNQDMPRSKKAYAAMREEDKILLVDWIEAQMPDADGVPMPQPSPKPRPSAQPSPVPSPEPSAQPSPEPSTQPSAQP